MNSKKRGNKKTAPPEIKIAVVGTHGVGKSALIVRFLTKRFISEYCTQQGFKYRHEMFLDGDPFMIGPFIIDIMETTQKSMHQFEIHLDQEDEMVFIIDDVRCENMDDVEDSDLVRKVDAVCLVYSITNRDSFSFVRHYKEARIPPDVPVTLVGNKADLTHLRQVSKEEGEILAKDFECSFAETAVTEQVAQVAEVFMELCREVLAVRRRAKHSLLDRMLGSRSTRVYSRGKSDSALPKE